MSRQGFVTILLVFLLVISMPGQVAATSPANSPTGAIAGEDCEVGFTDLLNAIAAYNDGSSLGGFDIGFIELLNAIEAYNSGGSVTDCGPNQSSETIVTVTNVVDGDTLDIRYQNGSSDTVRLLGVDTPEVHVETDPAEFEGIPTSPSGETWLRGWGENSSLFVERQVNGTQVTLRFDEQADRRGYYGRLLAYVIVNESYTLNYELVDDGYARVYESGFSNEPRYLAAEAGAQANGTGIWGYSATSAESDGSLAIAQIHEDAAGSEYDNLDDEYIVFENIGNGPLDLSGWTITDEAGHSYEIPDGVKLEAGEQLRLVTGSGTDTDSTLYWGQEAPVWNNGGDTVIVRNGSGETVIDHEYN